MSEDIEFMLGDKLPTSYDAAIAIFNITQNPKRSKMKRTIHAYYVALVNVWTKSFSKDHVMTRRAIITKLEKLVGNYYTQVYKKAHMKQGDGRDGEGKSIRQLNKIWRCNVMNKLGATNDTLLDIGKNMEMLIGDEKLFYEDQKSERIGRLSSDIDLKYVIEQEEKYLNEIAELGIEEEEYSFAIIETLDDESDFLNSTSIAQDCDINQSHNRSGLTRSTKQTCDVSVQTDPVIIDKPKLRIKERVCTEDIKMTCANLSSICGLSVENSRLAVQTVCKHLYKHEFYLSKADVNTSCDVGDDPPRKRNCLDLTYVLPSARTI